MVASGWDFVDALGDLDELVGRLRSGADVEGDAAHVALVRDVVAEDLDGHGEADLLGRLGALLCRPGDHRLDGADLVGVEHVLGLGLAQDAAPVASHAHEDLLDRVPVRLEVGEDVGGRLVEVREVARVLVHVHVGADGVLGGAEGGHVGVAQDAQRLGDLDLAHERGEQRLELVAVRDFDQGLRRARGVAHRLRREDREHAVAVGVVHQRLGGGGVAHRVGVPGDVDGVAARGEAGQRGLELLVGLRRRARRARRRGAAGGRWP